MIEVSLGLVDGGYLLVLLQISSMAQILSTLDGLVDTCACNMPIKYVLENEDIDVGLPNASVAYLLSAI